MMLETCSISLHHSRIAAVSVPMAETLPKAGIISGDHHNNQLLQMGSGSGGKLTLYKVLVCDGADEWFIFRRYNEFRELRDVIRHAFPRERIPFPGKRLFGSNFDPKFVLERRVGLDAFVQKVISIEDAMRMKEVRDFFNMDKPVCESTSSNDEGCSSNGSVNEPSSSESSTDSPSSADRLDLGSSERITSKPSDFEFLKIQASTVNPTK
ncbi:unnamed protein product [Notodromas monacha]|uniref:PX domain-containing protein n=1 Tax=Notodromas monacha TaxID=399045 RepID=A0A7R9GD68_9CRUS|nr:unnamed protein product [Notodromas monacha]CAG0916609.1 unnamed protein product [Notodromas monacha]